MKTQWKEIKEQVEFKTGEALDDATFKIIANETISELNEIAYIEAAPKYYYESDMTFEDDNFIEVIPAKWFDQTDQSGTVIPYKIFQLSNEKTYTAGTNQIKWQVLDEHGKETEAITVKEYYTYNNVSGFLTLTQGNGYEKDKEYQIAFFIKRIRGFESDIAQKWGRQEVIINLPENLSSVTKLEVTDQTGFNTIALETSINSLESGNEDKNNSVYENMYYISNNQVHLFFDKKPTNIVVYYIRRMSKITDEQMGDQEVEMEQNYESLLTLGITTKWWENFVGLQDNETKALYQRYMLMKKEYEEKNMPRKIKRRQKHIRVY